MAAAIGAGILVASFLIGLLGLVRGWTRCDLERHVLRNGYLGGLAGVLALILDLLTRGR